MRRRLIFIMIVILFVVSGFITNFQNHYYNKAMAFSGTILKVGSKGNDVKELQSRLSYIGYYKGTADGRFGYATLLSLKKFQTAFGIKPDGVFGVKTRLKLAKATVKWKAPYGLYANQTVFKSASLPTSNRLGFSQSDIKLMANAVHGESRGEPYEGQVAVAAVIINRIKNSNFPKTPSGVIFQPGAFTAVADGQIYLVPNAISKKAVLDAINGWDPTGGCIYYFNPATATNKWIWSRPQMKRIGKHIFCI